MRAMRAWVPGRREVCRDDSGFTLVELLITVALIAVLALGGPAQPIL